MADVDMAADARRDANGKSDWAARSVEGWIIIVTGLHEEATEEDLQDLFGEFGDVRNLSMALNRRTGYVMGYALVEYSRKEEAEAAIKETDGTEFLEKKIHTDFAFAKAPAGARRGGGRRRERSVSPARR
ncbi:RNA-binding domain-containing protein [Cutaneotrichosporon oleaginosum]|uniref:RNA-binding domain-containing protein n=1 Tax=Cutaneotrichosporon oleaginosum TaxID=879819 RepID=A0A0J1B393_9TREE|nr:RNA-binding domain-containing protein [Cutaneotrichosporon oleaginosum]KLT42089.1 RNA-binding domain-containing protein [Cutaneotrichosporon oleaginosum]